MEIKVGSKWRYIFKNRIHTVIHISEKGVFTQDHLGIEVHSFAKEMLLDPLLFEPMEAENEKENDQRTKEGISS